MAIYKTGRDDHLAPADFMRRRKDVAELRALADCRDFTIRHRNCSIANDSPLRIDRYEPINVLHQKIGVLSHRSPLSACAIYSVHSSIDNVCVTRAAAQMPADHIHHLFARRVWVGLQQIGEQHQKTWCAKAAL